MSDPNETDEGTVFDKIIEGSIPSDIVYETDDVLAFRDINPAAPTHILIIPKRRIVNVAHAKESDEAILGRLLLTAKKVAEIENLGDYRLVVNNGAGVGQTVFHLHLHLLAGRPFSWPPG